MVGTKPVSARFALLPETKPKMSALGTSVIVQICLAAFVVTIPLLFPQQMIPKAMYMVTEHRRSPAGHSDSAQAKTACAAQSGQGARRLLR